MGRDHHAHAGDRRDEDDRHRRDDDNRKRLKTNVEFCQFEEIGPGCEPTTSCVIQNVVTFGETPYPHPPTQKHTV